MRFVAKQVVFVDVDDTLVRSAGTKRIPMPRTVARVKQLHAQGAEPGINDCAFLPKPAVIIDDQPVGDWRYCRHELPSGRTDGLMAGTAPG